MCQPKLEEPPKDIGGENKRHKAEKKILCVSFAETKYEHRKLVSIFKQHRTIKEITNCSMYKNDEKFLSGERYIYKGM